MILDVSNSWFKNFSLVQAAFFGVHTANNDLIANILITESLEEKAG